MFFYLHSFNCLCKLSCLFVQENPLNTWLADDSDHVALNNSNNRIVGLNPVGDIDSFVVLSCIIRPLAVG
jgi:hypothetical protein